MTDKPGPSCPQCTSRDTERIVYRDRKVFVCDCGLIFEGGDAEWERMAARRERWKWDMEKRAKEAPVYPRPLLRALPAPMQPPDDDADGIEEAPGDHWNDRKDLL